jgi:hypothetical protein
MLTFNVVDATFASPPSSRPGRRTPTRPPTAATSRRAADVRRRGENFDSSDGEL